MSALILAALSAPGRSAQTLLVDNFESFTVGTAFTTATTPWKLNGSNPVTWARIDAVPSGNKCVRFHDDNGASTANNQFIRSFTAVTSGLVVAQFDVNLPQTTAGFGTRLCSGSPVTSGQYWCSALVFEGKVAYAASGASPGMLSYQTDSVPTYKVTPLSRPYSANTWYTVRVIANITTKTYRLFFGPKGGEIAEITPAGGVTFPNTASGHTVTQVNYITFFSSNRNGDDPGDLLIDNVNVYSDAETTVSSPTIAEARLLQRGTRLTVTNKIVTSGASGGVFYIQDDDRTAGIRVRAFGTSVTEGDRVDVTGRITQTSEGTLSDHCGEREIAAESVTVRSSGNLVPEPLTIRNMHITGAWFGPTELLADGYEPVVKGVWPYNSWGDSGVTVWLEDPDLLPPVNTSGLLVTAVGKVLEPTIYDAPGTNYDFYISDGSLKNDGWFSTATFEDEAFHPVGLRVRITDPAILSQVGLLHYGDVVKITGVAGAIACSDLGRATGRNVRVIRPRKPEDIQVIWRQPRYVKFDAQGNCLVDDKPFFPIGLFTYYWDSLTRPVIVGHGFNTVTTSLPDGITPAHLGELQSDHMMVMPYMANPGTYDAWLAMKDHPCILAWYITDEPEGGGDNSRATPQKQRADYEKLRASDPGHPIGTAHYIWDAFSNFRYSEDFTKSDIYPLHRAPITHVGLFIDLIHSIHGSGYPAWPYIQCFGGTEGFDIPSRAEERLMVYLALAHRAKGIMFFSYYPSLTETWAEVKLLVGEMKQLAPFYCLPSQEPALGNTNGSIHTRLIRIGDSGLIIAANVDGSAQTATFTIPSPTPDTLALPVEGGSIAVMDGQFTASFDSLAVHIYQWGPTPQADLFVP